jgi:uncharacterized protein DUF6763
MSTRLLPEVGLWYAHRDKGQLFQVVAVDEDEGVVEIQDFDGDVDEFDLDIWHSMPLLRAEAPEDSTGPVDDVAAEDLGYSPEGETSARDWRAPLDEFAAQPQEAVEAEDGDDESLLV